jgi:pilus assembly protein CpaB
VAGALSDAAPLADLVALVPIFPGQQILAQQWGAVAQTSGLALPAGKVAMSIQLGDPERVAGFVSPGSTVAIMTFGTIPTTTAGQTGTPNVRALLSNIEVIAVGPTTTVAKASTSTSTANSEQIPTAILTLAVTQREAEKIIFASGKAPGSTYSGLYFVLLDKNSKVVVGDPGVTSSNLFK